jgi:Arc/MetJ-type ribon-helix-helix transcriptional regulator
MAKAKLAITLDEEAVAALDALVRLHRFANRSQAIQEAVDEKLTRLTRGRLARECARLDPASEQALADEGLGAEAAEWPEF